MSPATRQPDPGTSPRKCRVGVVSVALNHSRKIDGHYLLKASSGPAGVPMKNHVPSGCGADPKISLPRLPISGLQILDRRFIHLDISTGHHSGPDLLVNRTQP